MRKKQPFYRNKVAMALRVCSYVNVSATGIITLRSTYLYLLLGWTPGIKTVLYFISVPFIVAVIEVLHTKAVKYGTSLYNNKLLD